MIRHMNAILWKQIKDTLKNKTILIQFLMFPILTLIMENTVKMDGMEPNFFTNLFGVMFIGMAPLTSMASIISEEKEKNTLRALLLSNVNPVSYLLGVGIYIWVICMLGGTVIGLAGGHKGEMLLKFLIAMGGGILLSILLGAVIGVFSKNQMVATSLTVPVMMIFSFLPMLAMFNETIEKIAKITYSQQIYLIFADLENSSFSMENGLVLAGNFLVAVVLFFVIYKKRGMEIN